MTFRNTLMGVEIESLITVVMTDFYRPKGNERYC